MNRNEFFEALQNGAKWDVGVSIARTNPLPLDANSVFESLEELTTYATTNPLAYPGQLCSVVGETEVVAYQIATVGEGALIKKLASSAADGSGGVEGAVTELQTKVANIINGTQVVGKATADAEGNVITTTYAKQTDLTAAQNKIKAIEDGDYENILNGVKVNQLVNGVATATELTIDSEKKVTIDLSGYATLEDANAIPKFKIQIVTELPTEYISTATIYLVPCDKHNPNDKDVYDEYIYVTDAEGNNGKWEKIGNTDVDLSNYYKKSETYTQTEVNTKITEAVQALDVTAIALEAGKTVKTISETDGKIAVETQDISITPDQVVVSAAQEGQAEVLLTNKLGELDTLKTLVGTENTAAEGTESNATGLCQRIEAVEKTQESGVVAEAAKVTNALTVGTKTFDGHEAVTIISSDLGLTGHTETTLERAVKLDTSGKAYVTIPEAMTYSAKADGGLETAVDGNSTTFAIKNDGVLTAMIKDAAVTDAKIKDVNVNKLVQTAGDSLVLDGGNAAGESSQNS